MFSNWYKSNPLRPRIYDTGKSSGDTQAHFYVWVIGTGEAHGPYRTLKSAKTFARIGATKGKHDRSVTRGRNPKNVVRYYQSGTGASLVHQENPSEKWERNIWTGDDILKVSKNERVIRSPWGPGQYIYVAEYWGDHSLKYPVKGQLRGTLQEAKKDFAKLKLKENPVSRHTYRVKAWTGPVDVKHYAQRLRRSGFSNVVEGTEHVYGDITVQTEDPAGSAQRLRVAAAWALFDSTTTTALRGISVRELK